MIHRERLIELFTKTFYSFEEVPRNSDSAYANIRELACQQALLPEDARYMYPSCTNRKGKARFLYVDLDSLG